MLLNEMLPVVCSAEVLAPAGSGNEALLTGKVGWLDAITTGAELADVACPFGLLGL
jgi:hypothetical protein